MKEIDLHTPLQFIKGIGKNRSKILNEEFGLKKCYDILNFFPSLGDGTILKGHTTKGR